MSVKVFHGCFWGVLVLWFTIVFAHGLQTDEVENLLAAWLIGHRGLIPIQDFPQLDSSVLWDLLVFFYSFESQGTDVIYYGRCLVLLCAVLNAIGFYKLGVNRDQNTNSVVLPGMLGAIVFIFASSLITSLFTIRPETIGIPAFIWSCVFWTQKPTTTGGRLYWDDVLAGTLFGLALLASPRFLLLGGVFFIFYRNRHHQFGKNLLRFLLFGIGLTSFISIYLHYSIFDFGDYLVSLRSLYQSNVDETFLIAGLIQFFILALIVLYLAYCLEKPRVNYRFEWELALAYLGALLVFTGLVTGMNPESQDIVPLLLFICGLLVYYQPVSANNLKLKELAQGLTVGVGIFALTSHHHLLYGEFQLADDVEQIESNLSLIPSSNSVILLPYILPVNAATASYYIRPFPDSDDRLCKALRIGLPKTLLPECSYWDDLKKRRPYLLASKIDQMIPVEQRVLVVNFIEENYLKCERFYIRLPSSLEECELH